MANRRDFFRTSFSLAFAGILPWSSFTRARPVKAGLPLIIDADTANEVDDLFAIVRALLEPTFDIKAINSAQFHTSPKHLEIPFRVVIE